MASLADFELRTMPGLWRWYEQSARSMAFRAERQDEAQTWQSALREIVVRLLGRVPAERSDLDPQLIGSSDVDGIRRELVVIQVAAGEYMPCYVLIPQSSPPYRPVIALHGHGTWGARAIVGIVDHPAEIGFMQDMNYDYGWQLARHGYLVLAPVIRGFGERMEKLAPGPVDLAVPDQWLSSCREVSFNAMLCGATMLGLRVWDVMRLIDYLYTRPEPLAEGLGCAGLSGGGMLTLFSTALDTRITCAVVAGYFCTFRDSIMSIEHCFCNYVPGLVQYAEMADIAGLIAPRPLLVQSGTRDPIFPVAGTQRGLEDLRRVYACLGASDALDADIFDGTHAWSDRLVYDWLARWL